MGGTPSAPGAPPLTLGTAGHIDHGKTALIESLTGVNTDRLPEERSRGISIELGYARLQLPSGRMLSVVDVPGHERFVRTMVAGATGIDLFLMVVAADDGVMPQTREHAAVLSGLGIGEGVVAVTKADVADPAAAQAQVRELLPQAEVVPTSARTGEGIAELRDALERVAGRLPGRADHSDEGARLHVDRSFTVRGAGTVVTGTLWSGSYAPGDVVSILPDGRRARVRTVHVHDVPVQRAQAGQRVALNLVGVEVAEVGRGDVVASGGDLPRPAHLLDVELEGAAREELAGGAGAAGGGRVQVHHGTRESPARVAPLGGRFFQLRLERPLIARAGDRLVVRRIAPPDTLGGGQVLDAAPRKHGPSRDLTARLQRLARGEPAEPPPAEPPPPAPATRSEAREPRPLSEAARALEERLRAAGREPPIDADLGEAAAELPALRQAGKAVRVGPRLHFHPDALAGIEARVVALCRADGSVTIASLRDDLGTTRKFAQALLEHFDAVKLTRRRGDEHVLRRDAAV